ncbi:MULTISPECIES: CocE/NonD family hydrolase [Gordonia]|jgi:putative CocE/NonD family hydrolase|nr:CocE/NonD family hydrolase [Gordonia sp. UBA5067]
MFAQRTAGLRAALCIAIAACAVLAVGSGPVAAAPQNAAETVFMGPIRGGNWFAAYIPTSSGAKIYADVLIPRNRVGRVPAVLAMGPYFQHYRQGGEFPVQQPPERYDDLVENGHLLDRGYAVVFADLRGFGGSTGCLDNSGPADHADIRAVVRWAATQRWSSGKVGMYGKSYDGVSGLVAAGERIPGLAAVVAQEPVYDWYRYLYGNGIPRTTRVGTPLSLAYTSMNPLPANVAVDSREFQNFVSRSAANVISPACISAAFATQSALPSDGYWQSRRMIDRLRGSTVPLFLSQGFIDQNTSADGLTEALHNMSGPVTGWLGMWDHVRGNDTDRTSMMGQATDRPSTGRSDYLEQVGQFYDHYLKGQGQPPRGFLVQDNTGSWRAQSDWPMRASTRSVRLNHGSYRYDGNQASVKILVGGRWLATQIDGVAAASNVTQTTHDRVANAVWTLLPPEPTAIRISGSPRVRVRTRVNHNDSNPFVQQTPVAVNIYDVDPSGRAVMITQNVSMLNRGDTWIRLFATDWLVKAGHRLVVRVTDANRGRWDYPVPTSNATVDVVDGQLRLPLGPVDAGTPTEGTSNTSLEGYLQRYTYPVPRS